MKKKLIIGLIVAVVLVAGGFAAWKFFLADFFSPVATGADAEKVSVSSVANITGFGSGIGSGTKFSGSVEPQKTLDVKKDSDKKISKLYVAAGDTVKQGDKLFKYDTDDISIKLEQAKLEVEVITKNISDFYDQIEVLKTQRDNANEDDALELSIDIQTKEIDVRTAEYEKVTKANNVTQLEKALSNTDVKSEIDGVVKTINSKGETGQDGQEKPYMSILGTGNYRVKGTVTELHINSLTKGQNVIIRSRVNPDQTWTGQIDTIDRENAVQNNQNGGMYYSGGMDTGAGATASKYNFYVALDAYEDLILGQHVFIELDFGQTEQKEGLWMPASYIVSEDGKSFVWARNSSEKLEKRQITLGEFDQNADTYQVKNGLSITDFIAFPQENYKNGMATAANNQGTANPDGGMAAGGDGGMVDGGEVVGGDGGMVDGGDGGMVDGGEVVGGDGGMVDGGEVVGGDGGMVDGGEVVGGDVPTEAQKAPATAEVF